MVAGPPRKAAPTAIWHPLALVGLCVVTVNIYSAYWLYRVYKHVRLHAPTSTRVDPARALGFLFVPLFNLVWAVFIWTDLPRAVRKMQEEDGAQETLADRSASGLILAGFAINLLLFRVNLAWAVAGECLFLAGLVLIQRALNEHQADHGVRVPVPPYPGIGIAFGTLAATALWFVFERGWSGRLLSSTIRENIFVGRMILAIVIGVVLGWIAVTIARSRDPMLRLLGACFAPVAVLLGQLWHFVWLNKETNGRVEWSRYFDVVMTDWRFLLPLVVAACAAAFAVRRPSETVRKWSDALSKLGAGA